MNTAYVKLWDNITVLNPMMNPDIDPASVTGEMIANQVVQTALLFKGCVEGDDRHLAILSAYNNMKPLPRGYTVKKTDAWCATYTSAIDIMCGISSHTPIECSCTKQIEIAKKKGIWVEADSYVPKIGDRMMYDWDDDGKGDNRNAPDHTGLIIEVKNGIITILDGNYKDGCNERTKKVDDRYIRGYICPKYDEIAKSIRSKLIVAGFIDVPKGVYFDTALEWAKKNDVVYGIDDCHFGPHLSTTRGQMITLLYRLYGNNVDVDITVPFTDVDPRGFYYKALKWGYKNNIVEGVTANEFDPHAACKRAEVVAMLHRLAGSVEPNMVYSPFDDVPVDSWYNDAVVWAHENGIVKGVTDYTFAPNADLLRRDTVCLLYRYAVCIMCRFDSK